MVMLVLMMLMGVGDGVNDAGGGVGDEINSDAW